MLCHGDEVAVVSRNNRDTIGPTSLREIKRRLKKGGYGQRWRNRPLESKQETLNPKACREGFKPPGHKTQAWPMAFLCLEEYRLENLDKWTKKDS